MRDKAENSEGSIPRQVPDVFRLDGKIAIVTGAARGLGAATARMLSRQGASVAIADLDGGGANEVAASIGNGTRAYQVNVSDVAASRQFAHQVATDFGGIDILVNNAGICPRLPFDASTEQDWEKLFSVNAKSQFFLCQEVCGLMRRRGRGGRIINVASTGGRVGGFANSSIYSGTKGAIVMFTKSIAREVAGDCILVNCVAPGILDTELVRNLPADRIAALCESIPLKRLGRPDEVAALIAFVASSACSYCTGATFDINGGWVML